jgi:hypothetical protein
MLLQNPVQNMDEQRYCNVLGPCERIVPRPRCLRGQHVATCAGRFTKCWISSSRQGHACTVFEGLGSNVLHRQMQLQRLQAIAHE